MHVMRERKRGDVTCESEWKGRERERKRGGKKEKKF